MRPGVILDYRKLVREPPEVSWKQFKDVKNSQAKTMIPWHLWNWEATHLCWLPRAAHSPWTWHCQRERMTPPAQASPYEIWNLLEEEREQSDHGCILVKNFYHSLMVKFILWVWHVEIPEDLSAFDVLWKNGRMGQITKSLFMVAFHNHASQWRPTATSTSWMIL